MHRFPSLRKTSTLRRGLGASAFALALCALQPVNPAQAEPGDGGLIYLSSGVRFVDTAPLTASVPAGQSLPGTPGGVFWDNGFGVLATVNRFLVGAEYHSLWGQLQQSEGRALRMDGNYGLLHLGYLAVATPRAQVFPYLGIGPGRVGLSSTESLRDRKSVV